METKAKYVDVKPSDWPPEVGAAIAAYEASKAAVETAITTALRSVNLCPADKSARLGYNYGKIGLAVDPVSGAPLTKAGGVIGGAFKFPAPAQTPAPAPAAQAPKGPHK